MVTENKKFISVDDALKAIVNTVKNGNTEKLRLSNATGYVLSKTLKSPIDSPPFSNSAMDGYAFIFNDFVKGKSIHVIGESAAGSSFPEKIKAGQAVRIFTGAEIPGGTDTVVMQEKTIIQNNSLTINDTLIKKGANIRLAGSQVKKNKVAVEKHQYLNPGSIGYLASLGINEVSVYKKPVVSVIITGNELVSPGRVLKPGQIFESNALTLVSALKNEGIHPIQKFKAKDTFNSTLLAFSKAFHKSDFVLFTGGISVGDYDFVEDVLKKEDVKTVFYKVRQKPGKPLYFGMKGLTYIFGLPGNPAAVLTCFYEYVLPALRKFQCRQPLFIPEFRLPLTKTISKKSGLTHFQKGFTDFNTVHPIEGQESFIMKSFNKANCFIRLDEDVTELKEGSLVNVHYFGC